AKQAVDDCFMQATEEPLLQQLHMRGVRKLLLEKALPFYEKFQARGQDGPDIQAEVAKNHFRVGGIAAEMGRTAESLESYNKARSLLEWLVRSQPEVFAHRAALAWIYNNLGNLRREAGFRAEALEWYSKARELREELVQTHSEVFSYRADLAGTYHNL